MYEKTTFYSLAKVQLFAHISSLVDTVSSLENKTEL